MQGELQHRLKQGELQLRLTRRQEIEAEAKLTDARRQEIDAEIRRTEADIAARQANATQDHGGHRS